MIGAEHIDELVETAADLRPTVGDICREVSIRAVGFDERPVDVVTELGSAKERLLAILPAFRHLALRRRQTAFIDMARLAQGLDRLFDRA